MASEQQLCSAMLSYLQQTLGDAVLNMHLVSGNQISLKKLDKPRLVSTLDAVLRDLLRYTG